MLQQIKLSPKNFVFALKSINSEFDSLLKKTWKAAADAGFMNYSVPTTPSVTPCNVKGAPFIILTLPSRFTSRRKPTVPQRIDEQLSPDGFNFTKVKPKELLFSLCMEGAEIQTGVVLTNVSPFTFGHSLLVPDPPKLFNQVIRRQSLELALGSLLHSADNLLCLGFNSLLAHASVNHLHYHLWYSMTPLHSATCPLRTKPALPAFMELQQHCVDNFVFEFTSLSDYKATLEQLWQVIDSCQRLKIAHNLFAARNSHGVLRVVLWPRRSVFEAKVVGPVPGAVASRGYNVAVAELAGMMVVADEATCAALREGGALEDILMNERLPDVEQAELHSLLSHNS
ncbi:GDP-D-glucose phosphorylase 1 [Sparganum proliferum]